MPDQLQLRGGTTVQHSTFTGASKEVTVDTTKKTVVVHDGTTAGGIPVMREDASNAVLALGSAATPSIKFTGDTDTGIYSPGANQVAISTNGTGRLFVDASGQVGIGATSPSALLDVVSASTSVAKFNGPANATVSFTGSGFVEGKIQCGGEFTVGSANNYPVAFAVNNTERARIDSSGRLLVGTSTAVTGPNQPQYAKLQVVGNTLSGARTGLIALGRSAAASTIVAGDGLGGITFGDNAAGEFACIFGEADGTAGTNDYPGRLVFSVTADGASSPTEAMRIKNSRIINIANTPVYADNAAAKTGGLVDGDVYRKSDGTLMIVYT